MKLLKGEVDRLRDDADPVLGILGSITKISFEGLLSSPSHFSAISALRAQSWEILATIGANCSLFAQDLMQFALAFHRSLNTQCRVTPTPSPGA